MPSFAVDAAPGLKPSRQRAVVNRDWLPFPDRHFELRSEPSRQGARSFRAGEGQRARRFFDLPGRVVELRFNQLQRLAHVRRLAGRGVVQQQFEHAALGCGQCERADGGAFDELVAVVVPVDRDSPEREFPDVAVRSPLGDPEPFGDFLQRPGAAPGEKLHEIQQAGGATHGNPLLTAGTVTFCQYGGRGAARGDAGRNRPQRVRARSTGPGHLEYDDDRDTKRHSASRFGRCAGSHARHLLPCGRPRTVL